MWQGNDCCASQTAQRKISTDFSANAELLSLIHSEDAEKAEEALDALVRLNMPLVRKIALRFCDRGVEYEDLLQIGSIGMIKAARCFDCERGTNFSTYAVPLIFGEIRRYLRDEGPIKVGRYYKKLGAMLLNEKNRIFVEEGREARVCELAELCGTTPEEAAIALDAISPIASLSEYAYGEEDGTELGDTVMDVEASSEITRISDRIALRQACAEMCEMWQSIVDLRYYRGLTQQQTADSLGITQVKVSREEKKILAFLRERLV